MMNVFIRGFHYSQANPPDLKEINAIFKNYYYYYYYYYHNLNFLGKG